MSMDQQRFLEDVSSHGIEIIRDDGLYRHIRFQRPSTICMSFDLITWPGVLCYTGDMGTYVFTRLADMFEFFRTDQDRAKPGELRINLGYWSEKLIAVDGGRRTGGVKEFSEEKFAGVIKDYFDRWLDGHDIEEDAAEELREAVQDDIIERIEPQDESYSYRLADEFRHDVDGKEFYFQDLRDYSFSEYTSHFVWCCYALSWGIAKYDAIKEPQS